jgi:hypothetical protein
MYNEHLEIGGQRRLRRAIARAFQFGLDAFGWQSERLDSELAKTKGLFRPIQSLMPSHKQTWVDKNFYSKTFRLRKPGANC